MSALSVSQRTIVLLLVVLFAALTALTTVSALTQDGGTAPTVEAGRQWKAPAPAPSFWRGW